jgi:predicted TIM-barrel fold metal-dependent hydrolase
MKIIDAQIHTWYPNTPERPWAAGTTSLHGPEFETEQALEVMDANGVHRAILVPPGWLGWDNEYPLSAARAYPDRFAVLGRFNVQAPDAEERLAAWRDQQGMLGIRIFFAGEPWMSMLTDRTYDWYWSGIEQAQIPMMCLVPGNMRSLHPVLERFPNLRLIIDHAGRHPRGPKDEAAWADLDETLAIARYPHTAIKVSSLPSFSTKPYPFPSLHQPLRRIYDTFGPQRMLWGSDVTRLEWGYKDNLRLFTEALDFLNDDDKEWILSRAAAKHCGWPL